MSLQTCRYEPFDTWFFRESRPQGAVGGSELGSVFPPSPRTLAGALRTAVGDAFHARHGTDWRQFAQLEKLQALIGFGDDLGPLSFAGPYVVYGGKRLYPAPANLMCASDGERSTCFLLGLGGPVRCDLGRVRLPAFPSPRTNAMDEARPASGSWLTARGYEAVLRGEAPAASEVIDGGSLVVEEPRLGVGRDNQRRAVQEGLLYQTRHLRLADGVRLEMDVAGLPANALPGAARVVCRLGGEGRLTSLELAPAAATLPGNHAAGATGSKLAIYLLSPMAVAGQYAPGIPDGFSPTVVDGIDAWDGEIADVRLRLWAVACSRTHREGGWDLANHRARAVSSYLPAGTVLYAELLDAKPAAAFKALQGARHGAETALGRGLLVAGNCSWKD